MKHLLFLLSALFVFETSVIAGDSLSLRPFTKSLVPADAFVFYVIGDWGRKGKYHQRKVAESMNKCATEVTPKFIISTGDNFYTFGVKSTKDKLWQKSYEDIYKGDAIKSVDWYPVLGNHDHYGNEEAEIEYSKINPHWKMPSAYYAAQFNTNNTSVSIVFTNTEPLAHYNNTETQSQWKWIDSCLSTSTATWKFAVGHHPVYSSNPMHGNTPVLIDRLKPMLEKYNVQAYFAGHDHDLQHQKPKGSAVDYFVSGAGSELRPSASYEHTQFAQSTAGFALVALTADKMFLYFIDEDGNVVYQYSRSK